MLPHMPVAHLGVHDGSASEEAALLLQKLKHSLDLLRRRGES